MRKKYGSKRIASLVLAAAMVFSSVSASASAADTGVVVYTDETNSAETESETETNASTETDINTGNSAEGDTAEATESDSETDSDASSESEISTEAITEETTETEPKTEKSETDPETSIEGETGMEAAESEMESEGFTETELETESESETETETETETEFGIDLQMERSASEPIYVKPNADADTADGTSANPYPTLKEAVESIDENESETITIYIVCASDTQITISEVIAVGARHLIIKGQSGRPSLYTETANDMFSLSTGSLTFENIKATGGSKKNTRQFVKATGNGAKVTLGQNAIIDNLGGGYGYGCPISFAGSGSTLIMESNATITGCRNNLSASGAGALVYFAGGSSTMTMKDQAKIYDGFTAGKAFLVFENGGNSFKMESGTSIQCVTSKTYSVCYFGGTGNTVTVDGTISDCNHTLSNGTIAVEGDNNSIVLNGTISNSKNGIYGGAIYLKGNGNSIQLGESAVVTDCTVTEYGGAIYVSGNNNSIDMKGKISNCTAATYKYGGGIYAEGNTNSIVISGEVSSCSVANTKSIGGGVYLTGQGSSFTLSATGKITGCNAMYGGAVGIISTSDTVVDIAGTITECSNSADYKTGAIYMSGSAKAFTFSGMIKDSGGRGASNGLSGGAICMNSIDIAKLEIGGSIESCCSYANGGAVCITGRAKEFVLSGLISECYSQNGTGGAVYAGLYGSNITMTSDAKIKNCYTYSSNGGAICLSSSDETQQFSFKMMQNALIDTCYSNKAAGGAIYLEKGVTCELGGTINGCYTNAGAGGAVYQQNQTNTLVIKDTAVFNKCIANGKGAGYGGAVYIKEGTVSVLGGTFNECSAYADGGVLYISGTAMLGDPTNQTYPVFRNCSAANGAGGGIYAYAGTLVSYGAMITGCSASTNGGGFVFEKAEILVYDITIKNCSAQYGGGISLGSSTMFLLGCHITECTASTEGGGIYVPNKAFYIRNTPSSSNLTYNAGYDKYPLVIEANKKSNGDKSNIYLAYSLSYTQGLYIKGTLKEGSVLNLTTISYTTSKNWNNVAGQQITQEAPANILLESFVNDVDPDLAVMYDGTHYYWTDGYKIVYDPNTAETGSAPEDITKKSVSDMLMENADGTATRQPAFYVYSPNYTNGSKVTVVGNTGKLKVEKNKYYVEEGTEIFDITQKMKKEGYRFAGWSMDPDASTSTSSTSTIYKAGESFTYDTSLADENKTITLYAVWEELQYSVSYDANQDGCSGTVPEGVSGVLVTEEPIYTVGAADLTYEGMKFLGWSTQKDATEAEYSADGKATMDMSKLITEDSETSEIKLYGVWVPDLKKDAIDAITEEGEKIKEEIDKLPDLTDEEKEALKKLVDKTVDEAIKEIEAIEKETDKDAIDKAAQEAIDRIDGIGDKAGAIDEIEAAVKKENETINKLPNLTDAEKEAAKEEIRKEADKAIGEINDAADQDGIDKAKNDGLTEIDKTSSITQVEDKADEIKEKIDFSDLSKDEKEALKADVDKIRQEGIDNINAGTTVPEVDKAREDTLDKLKDFEKDKDFEDPDDLKEAAKEEIDKEGEKAKEEIDKKPDLTDKEKEDLKEKIDKEIIDIKDWIDKAGDGEELDKAKEDGKDRIENVLDKAGAIDEIEAAVKKENETISKLPNLTDAEKEAAKEEIRKEADKVIGEINDATDQDGIDKAKNDGLTEIDKTSSITQVEDKADGIKEKIDSSSLPESKKDELKKELDQIKDDGIKDINAGTTVPKVDKAREDTLDKLKDFEEEMADPDKDGTPQKPLDDVKDDAKEDIDDATEGAKGEIDNLPNLPEQDKEDLKNDIDKEADKAKEEIDKATTPEEVEKAKNDGLDAIEKKLEEGKAISEIETTYLAIKEKIENSEDLTDREKEELLAELEQIREEGLEAVRGAETLEELLEAKADCIQKMEGLLAAVQTGDETNLAGMLLLFGVSAAALGILILLLFRRKKQTEAD